MNLAKAKEILNFYLHGDDFIEPVDLDEAIRLSVEAATWVELCRVTSPGTVPTLFHGESED